MGTSLAWFNNLGKRTKIVIGVIGVLVILIIVGSVLPRSESPPPTPTPVPPTPGLGVSAVQIQNVFSLAQWGGFTFESVPLSDGTPRILGRNQNDDAAFDLIGSPDNLTEVTLLADIQGDAQTNSLYFNSILVQVMPDWEGSSEWLNASIREASRTFEVQTTIRNGKTISFLTNPDKGLMGLTIKTQE